MIESREWIFRVSCKVDPGESVFVTGSCQKLGAWDPQRLLPLLPEASYDGHQHDGETIWRTCVPLPAEEVRYRFCVCVDIKNSNKEVIHSVRRWETYIHPRVIPPNVSNVTSPETLSFGLIAGFNRVDQGWLFASRAVFLRLCKSHIHNDPVVLWKKKHKNKKCYVKVTPINTRNAHGKDSLLDAPLEDSTEAELMELRVKSKSLLPIVEVSVLKEGAAEFRSQEQFGVMYNDEDYIAFRCILADLESTGFLLDFYVEMNDEVPPNFIGCSFVLPSTLKDNYGVASLPITSTKHIPIGQLTVNYMVVHPIEDYNCDMKVSYSRHWKESWRGLDVGHRGAGNSFHSQTKNCANIRENTIASLKHASENGADMVEFDVQLSKDLVPLIYHDFHAYIALKHKKEPSKSDLMEIPIKDLTLAQLQKLKVYHLTEKGLSRFSDDDLDDHQPFPTLAQALESVPESCGFNIEIKWTMRLKDGTYELQHPIELNRFLDTILKVILPGSSSRKIVLSCFHPDICTMLRLKQNLYPVLFLTFAENTKWIPYDDIRTTTTARAILYATSANILGINVHTSEILDDPSRVQMAFDHNLILFCWGDENCDQETICYLKELGLHGIIYDKIDAYNTKKDKKKRNVFLCDDKETCRCFPLSCNKDDPSSSPSSAGETSPPPATSPADKRRNSLEGTPSPKRPRNDSEGSTGSRNSFCGILANLGMETLEAQS